MIDSMLLLDIGPSAGELPNITPAPTVYGCWFPVPHHAVPVPTVSGLTATPVADGILLEWDAIDLPDVVYVIERATAETGPWFELARTTNTHYLVSDPSGETWFFRVIAVVRGRAGDDTWVEGKSKVIAGDEDIAELIEKQKEIDEARVLEKVELIDLNAEELLKEILRSHEFNDLRREHGDTISRAVTDIALLIEDGHVTAQQVTDLFAQLADASAALNEQINTARADANSALATANATLGAQITAGDSAVSTALHQRADEVEATAASARTAMQNTWAAQLNNTQALLQSSINTKVTANQATTIAQTQVQAFQNGTYATLVQSFNVVANEHNDMHGKWSASWGVKLTGGTFNGQPVVAGISMSANPNTGSAFIIQSHNFHVISQDAGNGLELRNGHLRVFRGSVQRIIGNGFGQDNQLVDYFGPNVGTGNASKTDAVMWMDTSGNAMFKGKINASNIVGDFQERTWIHWTGLAQTFNSTNGFSGGTSLTPVIAEFTLPAPKSAGDSHTPYLDVVVEMQHLTASVGVLLEMWSGSDWLPVAQRESPYVHLAWSGNDNTRPLMEKYIPFSAFHDPQTGARTYRIRVTSTYARNPYSNTGLSAYVTRINGYIVGIR